MNYLNETVLLSTPNMTNKKTIIILCLNFSYSEYTVWYNKGIIVFKIFIWGGILLDIWSEIQFYGDARVEP